ncbi:MAG TPA: hypothetical protein VIP28_07430 [Nocardioides sp.]
MDVDVVPGSVTDWTVTLEDQRRLKRAMVGLPLRSATYWLAALGLPVLMSGFVWFVGQDLDEGPVSHVVVLASAVIFGVLVLVLQVTMPLVTARRRVERELPVGATLQAWSTTSGIGVRTVSRLTFYPWSRLTRVDVGPVLVRCRQRQPWRPVVPTYFPAGPDEPARSVDFPAQLLGPEIRRELEMRIDREPAGTSTAGRPVVVDRSLWWRLVRAWVGGQFGILPWFLPACFAISVPTQLAVGSYRLAIFMAGVAVLNSLTWWLTGAGRTSGTYPIGATVVGSVGEWLEIQGPWGSVAWHHTWLRQRRMTKHSVTYEMLQVGPDGGPVSPADIDKRIVVIPRALLDTPAEAVSAEV